MLQLPSMVLRNQVQHHRRRLQLAQLHKQAQALLTLTLCLK